MVNFRDLRQRLEAADEGTGEEAGSLMGLASEVAVALTSLREKVVKIGAKVVAHGRYLIFQMAEVAVPHELFRGILQRIAGLRPAVVARC
jgi:hypothetical protein